MPIDFNNSDNQSNFDLIPNNTLAKVRMTIRPGGYDDEAQGWTGGYATKNEVTGSIYLSCEFIVLEGQYARRKIWGLIGLHSNKGPEWSNIGKSFIKAILNSAHGISENDNSPQAQNARKIDSFADLDGIEFIARITTKKDQYQELKNEIRSAITPDHQEYQQLMGNPSPIKKAINPALLPNINNRPSWAI